MYILSTKDRYTFPILFVVLLWIIHSLGYLLSIDLLVYGIQPRILGGLKGILFAPLIHFDFAHLISNSLPLIFLGILVFTFYRKIAFEIFIFIYFGSNVLIWIGASRGFHFGASAIIYGFIAFLIFSGLFRRNWLSLLIALGVAFFYSGSIYGLLPGQSGVSWEGHLFGAIIGAMAAWFYRNEKSF